MHYLDNASTTPVAPQALAVINEVWREDWANPSSLYRAGLAAERRIEDARGVLAKALGCLPKEVFFTGSGTEGNNIAILGAARQRAAWAKRLVATGYEHPAVSAPLRLLAKREGFELVEVAPRPDGTVDMAALVAAVDKTTALVCAMHVNNETGAVLDVAALASAVKAKNPRTFVHVDGVQGFCKLPLDTGASSIDAYATSGHKLNAPKGVGALYLRGGSATNLVPVLAGGGQEGGLRPGTQNTAYIAAYATAVQGALAARAQSAQQVAALRSHLLAGLAAIGDITVHSPQNAYPGIVFFSLPPGYKSEMMIHHLDEGFGVCVSGGSACSGGGKSHTLQAMGVPDALIDTALRISFAAGNTPADIGALLAGIQAALAHRAAGRPGS